MLNIITPCSRPENLLTIAQTIPSEARWIICYDDRVIMPPIENSIIMKCENTGAVGALALNHILDNFCFNDNDWILVHDDDNIIHPELYNNIKPFLNSDYSMIYWGQIENNVIRIPLEKLAPAVECIDTACYMIKWKLNSQLRHQPIYSKDGIYASQCAKNGPIIKINKYLCYYNYLR
jgi:hypothetical protein